MYYLDFCAKYRHEESNRESLSRFIEKLKEKKQVEEKRKQASKAVAIFYELALLAGTALRRRVNGLPYGRHGGRPYVFVRFRRTSAPQAYSCVGVTRARAMSVCEAVNRGHDKMFALNSKKDNISTKKGQLRHPDDSGVVGPQRRENYNDLYANDQEHDHQGGEQSAGFLRE